MSERSEPEKAVSFGGWMGSMWLYTVLRVALFFAIWGVLVLIGVTGFIGAVIAAIVSIPLSYFLLSVPRQRFAAKLEQRVNERREERAKLDDELDPDSGDDELH
jgi:O-antigen ligase